VSQQYASDSATGDTAADRFAPFAVKMQQAGLSDLAIQFFQHYYAQLLSGATG
jgi:hypothetical protein